jgi:hypothetical protein
MLESKLGRPTFVGESRSAMTALGQALSSVSSL